MLSNPARISPSREVPLGRSALWLCLGLGLGSALGAFAAEAAAADNVPFAQAGLKIFWPLLIAGMAVILLVVGTLPGERIVVSRSAAQRIEEYGIKGVARVRSISVTTAGPVRTVAVSLEARSRQDRTILSDLVWRLDAIDAQNLRRGTVIPVRIDPNHVRRIVLDTRADSRQTTVGGLDPNEVFSAKNKFRSRLHTMRLVSWVALAVGGGFGFLVGMLF